MLFVLLTTVLLSLSSVDSTKSYLNVANEKVAKLKEVSKVYKDEIKCLNAQIEMLTKENNVLKEKASSHKAYVGSFILKSCVQMKLVDTFKAILWEYSGPEAIITSGWRN